MSKHLRVLRHCVAALALWPILAVSDVTLASRLQAVGEDAYFLPDQALPALRAIEAELAAAPLPLRAEFLYHSSTAERSAGNLPRALELADELVGIGERHKDGVALAKGLVERANALYLLENLPASHASAFAAERVANRTGDAVAKVLATHAVGQAYQEQGNYPAALSKLQLALDMARRIGNDNTPLASVLQTLVLLYLNMGQLDAGWEAQRELREVALAMNSPGFLAVALRSEYVLAIEQQQLPRARRALLDGLDLERRIGARQMAATTLVNLADFHLKERNFRAARTYAEQALQAATEASNNSDIATARLNLGQALLGLGWLAEGKRQFELGLATFEQQDDKPELQVVLLEYGGALEQAGDYKGAIRAYQREREISRAMFDEQRTKAVLELQEQYNAEKKARQIQALHRENRVKQARLEQQRLQQRLWWLLAAVFALGSGIVGLLHRKIRRANAQLTEKNLELKHQGSLDPLTMLHNRRYFKEFMHAQAYSGTERRAHDIATVGALFLLDIDHFKRINDTLGHAAGDMILKAISQRLQDALREADVIVRWGGEEFLAFLPAVAPDGLEDVARRILHSVASATLDYQGTALSVTVSVGFAPFPLRAGGATLTWERVVNLIDMALYLAKSEGRNRAFGVRGFSEPGADIVLEQDLEQAWRKGHVDLSLVLGPSGGSASGPG